MKEMRWMISEDGGSTYTREVVPFGLASYSYERDLNSGQIFFRHKLNSKLQFNRKDDWDYFYGLERKTSKRCMELFIQRQWKCGVSWRTYWTGTFSVGAGGFNLDQCIFSVKPEVSDRYACVLKNQSKKVNALSVPPSVVTAIPFPSNIEFAVCAGFFGACALEYGLPPDYLNGWNPVPPGAVFPLCGDGTLVGWWREKVTTDCVNGNPVPPAGEDWALLTNNCDEDGTAIWVRPPSIPWTYDDMTVTTSDSSEPVIPEGDCDMWVYMGTALLSEFGPCYAHGWMCPSSGDPITYNTARPLMQVGEFILEKSGCGIDGIVSDFFEWNPYEDAPGYTSGFNYITGRENEVDHLMLVQKSDAIDPLASNPASIGEMTFKEFMQLLASMRIYWDITSDGKLRLEHWKYWTFPQGLDLGAYETIEQRDYEHLSIEVPRYERARWMEAQGTDFVGNDIEYSGPCVSVDNQDEVKEYAFGRVTTDVAFINADPAAISKEGFALLATDINGSDYSVILGVGAISGSLIMNAPMSTANLQRDFWTWDRFLPNGNLNGQDVEFDGFLPNIQQRPIVVMDICCDLIALDPKKRVASQLGTKLGNVLGHVHKIEFEDQRMTTTITLRYPYK